MPFFKLCHSRGYKEQEIRDLFNRYDKNCDGILDQDDQEAMRMDLQDQEVNKAKLSALQKIIDFKTFQFDLYAQAILLFIVNGMINTTARTN